MRSRRQFSYSLALLLLCVGLAKAEARGPGPADIQGKIVSAQEQVGVYGGAWFKPFPETLKKRLIPYLGQHVRINYQTTDYFGHIGTIDKITVLFKDDSELPLAVQVRPTKDQYSFSDPIELIVKITNSSQKEERLHLYSSRGVVLKDYRSKGALSSNRLYGMKKPYGFNRIHRLPAGAEISFKLTSQHYVEPGEYDAVFYVSRIRDLYISSNFAKVKVVLPEGISRSECLKAWLARNTEQVVPITKELLTQGDRTGISVLLQEAENGNWIGGARLLWEYGGERAETALMRRIRESERQGHAAGMIEDIPRSMNRTSLLLSLLDEQQPTRRDIAGWVAMPRICDITASWLIGYSDGKLTFPQEGTLKERNQMVEQVRTLLKTRPNTFTVLQKRK